MRALFPAARRELAPGAVLVPGWLDQHWRQRLVAACREWARGPVPLRAATLPGGGRMSVRTVCLGWHWRPHRYTRVAEDAGGGRVTGFPDWLADLGREALTAAGEAPALVDRYRPDAALVNYYDATARMGMHQDRDERVLDPVVSLSIGDSCVFRLGGTERRSGPHVDTVLESGDLLVLGGPSRLAYHGVPRILPGTADPDCGLRGGRLNITLRVTGLS